jgi:8-amino-7-oxononanoate synthase
MSPFLQSLADELAQLQANDRLRACPALSGSDRIHVRRENRPFLSFASNDYLGLASHPLLAAAAAEAGAAFGSGSAAARLVSGDLPPHRDLEAALSKFLRLPDCLSFSTGYQANLAAITALAGPSDLIVSDQANHASLIDGCRLSRATVKVFKHGDALAARQALQTGRSFRRRLLVTESLFSMDGDIAPLPTLADAARENDAVFVVDEAHALGVLGPGGRGLCAATDVIPDVLIGTMGKAFGSFGGFVAGESPLRSFLLNKGRTFIFTTAVPPAVAAAGTAAIALASGPEGDERRRALRAHCDRLAAGLASRSVPGSPSPGGPIFPVILGSDQRALAAARLLSDRGIFVPAIRPPTVPESTARLRVTISAAHQPEEIDALLSALTELAP